MAMSFDPPSRVFPPPASLSVNRAGMLRGFVGSWVLHIVAGLLLVLWLLPSARQPLHPVLIMPINLVHLAPKTRSPPALVKALVPQRRMAQQASTQSAKAAVLIARAIAPPVARPRGLARRQRVTAHPDLDAQDSLAARLDILARLRQATPREDIGLATVTTATEDSPHGQEAAYAVKNFIFAQIERHWSLDTSTLDDASATVRLHLKLSRDGIVELAQIVDTPRLRTDSAYRDFAYSARNAALAASPITIPSGAYGIAKDLTLEFDSSQALR